jgi:hypothetical protein
LPEPWSSGEAKHVLDAALTMVTRLSGYEFDPPLDGDTRDEIMAYAIGAVGQRGSEGWVAWESGGERIMHPVAADDPYFDCPRRMVHPQGGRTTGTGILRSCGRDEP